MMNNGKFTRPMATTVPERTSHYLPSEGDMAGTRNNCRQPSTMMQQLDLKDKEIAVTDDESLALVTPLPRRELFLIWITHASQGFQTTMLFPMLVFMVEKYGKAGNDSHAVGYYAGILAIPGLTKEFAADLKNQPRKGLCFDALRKSFQIDTSIKFEDALEPNLEASLFPLAQFCSSILWGVISDRYGRRRWLAFGNAVSAVSSLLLGLSQTFASACLIRFLGGLLNGTVIITKSALAELCDGTNQAQGFGILNLAWGVGAIAGPVVSGVLAQPCVQYKLSHCPLFFQTHPFFLPCLSATLISSMAVWAALSMKETNSRIDAKNQTYRKIPSEGYWDEENSASERHSNLSESEMKEVQYFEATFCKDPETDLESDQVKDVISRKTRLLVFISTQENVPKNLRCTTPSLASIDVTNENSDLTPSFSIPTPTRMSILKDRDVLLSSFCYSMTGFIFIIADELFPMFGASAQSVGGLGFSSADLGIVLGEGGLVLFIYTIVLYPRVAKRFGPLRCFRYGILGSVPVWLLFPACSMVDGHPTLLWSLLLFTMSIRSVVSCATFTGVLILVSNSAMSENMGTVTGLSHSLCSFFRAIGPAFGGALWSYTSTKTFPMHQFMAWSLVALLSMGTYGLSFLLAPTLVLPKDDR